MLRIQLASFKAGARRTNLSKRNLMSLYTFFSYVLTLRF